MSASADTVKELTEEALTEEQRHLIPKLLGQTTDELKVPTKQVFKYVYKILQMQIQENICKIFNHGCISEDVTIDKITLFQH